MKIKRDCIQCGSPFWLYPSEDTHHSKPRRFCGKKCFYKYPVRIPIKERIKRHSVTLNNGCIVYTTKHGKPYPYFPMRVNKKSERVYRIVYELYRGPIPQGKQILHSCDNGACININHLSLGTNLDNVRDMMKKNRQAKGEQSGSHKLSAHSVRVIKEQLKRGILQRVLANEHMVSKSCIQGISNGRTWRHI